MWTIDHVTYRDIYGMKTDPVWPQDVIEDERIHVVTYLPVLVRIVNILGIIQLQ